MKSALLYYCAIILAFYFGIYTYKYHLHPSSSTPEPNNSYFKVPRIGQNLFGKPLSLYEQDHLFGSTNHMMGKFAFTDYIYLDQDRSKRYGDDFFIPPHYWWDSEYSLYPSDGLQLKLGHRPQIRGLYDGEDKAHFPLYIINETNSTKYLFGAPSNVSTLIEAKDKEGVWRPIEYRNIIGCLTGTGFIKIHPKEFCVLAIPSFKGGFKTQIRVKLKNQHSILISNTVQGYINEAQFKFKSDNWLKKDLEEEPWCKLPYLFFGSVPLEFASSP